MASYEFISSDCYVCGEDKQVALRYDDRGIPHYQACEKCEPSMWRSAADQRDPGKAAEAAKAHEARALAWERMREVIKSVSEEVVASGGELGSGALQMAKMLEQARHFAFCRAGEERSAAHAALYYAKGEV